MPCHGCTLVILMKFYINRSMKECKNDALPRFKASERWWMFAAFMTLVLKGEDGLLRKKVTGGSYCRVCLDRALATPVWNSLFLSAMVRNLAAAASDHGSILLRWRQETGGNRKQKGKKLFKYETMWETHEDFSSWLTETWQGEGKAGAVQELQQKIAVVTSKMEGWGQTMFGNVHS